MVALRQVLTEHPGDCAVYLHLTLPGESETVLSVGGVRGVEPSDAAPARHRRPLRPVRLGDRTL